MLFSSNFLFFLFHFSHFPPFFSRLPLAQSPFIFSFQISQSLSDFHCLSIFEFSVLQPLTVPPHLLLCICAFPPSMFCHSPVIICNSANERENVGATSLPQPCSLYWLQFTWPATKPRCSVLDWLQFYVLKRHLVDIFMKDIIQQHYTVLYNRAVFASLQGIYISLALKAVWQLLEMIVLLWVCKTRTATQFL